MSTGAALQHSPRTTIPAGSVRQPTIAQRDLIHIGREAERRFGLTVAENPWFGGVSPVHATDSNHYKGLAIDVSGDPAKMDAFAKSVERRYGPVLAELIHNGGSGGSYSIKNGQSVPSSFWGAETWAAHGNHVHVALAPSLLRGKQSRFFGGGRGPNGGFPFPFKHPAERKRAEEEAKEENLGEGFLPNPGEAASSIADEVVSGILGDIHPEALMLNIGLIGGGAFLVYYGAALMLGVKTPAKDLVKAGAEGPAGAAGFEPPIPGPGKAPRATKGAA
jgi:hypothetical protein